MFVPLGRPAVEPVRENLGDRLDVVGGFVDGDAAMVEDLNHGSDRDGHEKSDDKGGDRAP